MAGCPKDSDPDRNPQYAHPTCGVPWLTEVVMPTVYVDAGNSSGAPMPEGCLLVDKLIDQWIRRDDADTVDGTLRNKQ